MIRVCHLGKYYPPAPGGIETHVQTLARAQHALGLDVSVLCMNHERRDTPPELDNGVRVQRFKKTASLFEMHFCAELIRAIRSANVDLFHLQVPNPVMLLHTYVAKPAVPIVVTYQSDIVRQRWRAALFRPFERRFYRRVSRILPTSQPYADGSAFLRNYRDRVTVLPMGQDLEPYLHPSDLHQREAAGLRARYPGPLWFSCGRLVYYKGLLNAIRALKHVPGTLLVVGSGPELDALTAEARALDLQERVVFVGTLNYLDIIPYYLAATAFWFPSNARSEAFGLVHVEAMACGCPVINTAIPASGVSWVSRHDESGLTIPMNDPEALAAASRRLLDEAGLRDRLSAGGVRRAKSDFDQRVMAERCLAVYDSVLNEVKRQPR